MVEYIRNGLIYFVAIAAVVSIVFAGIKMVLTAKGQPLRGVLRGLIALIIVSAAGVPVLGLLIAAGDSFSTWFVGLSTGSSTFGTNMTTAMVGLSEISGGPILVIIFGIVAIIASVVQVVLILVRMVMLVLLAGMLPMAASFASTDAGWEYLKKYGSWLLAFLLYKPVAAIIYGVAFALIDNGVFKFDSKTLDVTGQSLMNVLAGLLLMVLAIVALAALMKFVVPSVGAIGGGAIGSAIAGGVG
ncbi:MAG: hypothetical protein M3N46_05265, partial [Actinomycetota bacterium]|nr:hypothetical protein [Actinomycetota bacterium]